MNKRKTLRMTSILLALMMFFGMVSVLLVPAGVGLANSVDIEIDIPTTSSLDTDNYVVRPEVGTGSMTVTIKASKLMYKGDIANLDGFIIVVRNSWDNDRIVGGTALANQVKMYKIDSNTFGYDLVLNSNATNFLNMYKSGLYTVQLYGYQGSHIDMDNVVDVNAAFWLAEKAANQYWHVYGKDPAKVLPDATAGSESYKVAAGSTLMLVADAAITNQTGEARYYVSSSKEKLFTVKYANIGTAKEYLIPKETVDGTELNFTVLNINETAKGVYVQDFYACSAHSTTNYDCGNIITVDSKGPEIGNIAISNSNLNGKTVKDGKLFWRPITTGTYNVEIDSITDNVSSVADFSSSNQNRGQVYARFTNIYNTSQVVGFDIGVSGGAMTCEMLRGTALSGAYSYYTPTANSYHRSLNFNSASTPAGLHSALVDGTWKLDIVAYDSVGNESVKEYGRVTVYEWYRAISDIRVEAENVLTMYKGQVLTKEEILNQNVKVQTNTESSYGASYPNAWYFFVNASDSAYLDYDPEAGTITALQAGEARLTASPYDIWANENLRSTIASSATGQYIRVVITDAPTVTSLTLNNTTMTIDEGQTQKLTATAVPSAVAVTWETSDSSIATVASDGTVTGVKAGTAVIFAKAGHLTKSCVVTVKSTTIVDPDPPAEDLKGWVDENNNRYYYVDNQKVVGWRKIDGSWYFFDYSTAAMRANGWLKEGGKWYYLNSNGTMKSAEWFKDNNGKWYWLKANGAMAAGWEKINGTWYYFNASGAMQTGWVNVRGIWYYMKSSGAMAEGWLQDGGSWYYLTPGGGAMVTGRVTINGRASNFATSGRWLGYV